MNGEPEKAGYMYTTLQDENGLSATATLSWRECDPLVIRFDFNSDTKTGNTWDIERDKLHNPMRNVIQRTGDCVVFIHGNSVYMGLESQFGATVLKFNNWNAVSLFVEQTYQLVAVEDEADIIHAALDVELAEILGD